MTTSVAHPAAARQPAQAGAKDFRYDIGGLRGLAILIVVTGHLFEQNGLLKWPDWIATLVDNAADKLGYNPVGLDIIHIHGGVDMSFALSGYLITWLAIKEFLKRGGIDLLAFYGRRVRRLVPAATLVTLATLAASMVLLSPLRVRGIAGDALATSLPVPLLNYWLGHKETNYFEASMATKSPFEHYWSLNVEEQFYLVYPVLLIAALVIGRKLGKLRLTVGITLAAIVAVSLTWSIIQTGTNQPMAYFGAHTRAWELALGALVAVAQPLFKRLPHGLAALLSWLGLATVFVTICIIESYPLPGFAVSGPVLGVLLVIIGGEARPRRGAESVLRFRPLQYIGKISYQWYLWHWPVLILLPSILGRRELGPTDLLLVLFGSFALAAATWHGLDSRIRESALFEKPGKAIGMGVHLVIVTLVLSVIAMFAVTPNTAAPSAPANANGFTPLTTPTRPVNELPRLIEEGTQLQELPANVKAVTQDINKRDGLGACLVDDKTVQPEMCPVGDLNAKVSVAVLGDSHTTHWKPALEAIGKRRGIQIMTAAKQTCPAEAYVHIDPLRKTRYTQCEQWREIVYRQIEALRPKVVIFASREWDDMTAEGVAASTKRFTSQGIRVVALGNTPKPLEDIPSCLDQNPDAVQKCTTDRTEATQRGDLREIRKQAAISAGGTYIDTMNWFCTATACPAVINNVAVYSDAFHITRTYADWVSPELEQALKPVLD